MDRQIALITASDDFMQGRDPEVKMIRNALHQHGLNAEIKVWDELDDPASFDLLIIRSPWDYPERFSEFKDWLALVKSQVRILNTAELIEWNFDKRYLNELAAEGVRITPTDYCSSVQDVVVAIERLHADGRNAVVKPNISVGSRQTGLFPSLTEEALTLAREILGCGKIVLVQPEIETIAAGGERGLLFFNGRFSHAIRKGPILQEGGGFIGGKYTEHIALAEVSEAEIELGRAVLSALERIGEKSHWEMDSRQPLYARIDVATGRDDKPYLIEAELFEPSLFTRFDSRHLNSFATAVSERF